VQLRHQRGVQGRRDSDRLRLGGPVKCALVRSNEPGSVRSGSGPDRNPSRAAAYNLPTRVRAAVDWTGNSADRGGHRAGRALLSRGNYRRSLAKSHYLLSECSRLRLHKLPDPLRGLIV
jgi:hypothetical protein